MAALTNSCTYCRSSGVLASSRCSSRIVRPVTASAHPTCRIKHTAQKSGLVARRAERLSIVTCSLDDKTMKEVLPRWRIRSDLRAKDDYSDVPSLAGEESAVWTRYVDLAHDTGNVCARATRQSLIRTRTLQNASRNDYNMLDELHVQQRLDYQ
jgi:hypothetical protein